MNIKTTAAAALAVAAGVSLFALPAAHAETFTHCDVDSAALKLNGEEPEVFTAINKMRTDAGLRALTYSETMARPSEWAGNDSANRGVAPANHVDSLGRDIKTRFAQCGVPANSSKIAEINYYGTNVTPSDAMTWWKNSPTHKAIILDGALQNVGVSAIYKNGKQFWTVTFNAGGTTVDNGTHVKFTETRSNLTGAQHQAEFDKLTAAGYRLTDITATSGSDPRYSSTWVLNDGRAWQARHGLTSAQYQATFDQLKAQGYRPTLVNGYEVNGSSRFVAIWEKTDGRAWEARHDIDLATYNATATQLSNQGYKLEHLSKYMVNGTMRYAALWDK
ncbi:CAP domain-containing protein [Nocardia sp. CA-145437]|uniref:CAP domain-containing protein n=1 Tax=Nocardia sp. CA-145437 TaxID=3239980 RepID=UPI003D96DC28